MAFYLVALLSSLKLSVSIATQISSSSPHRNGALHRASACQPAHIRHGPLYGPKSEHSDERD
eukprot:364756-Chlamydomonas_euryale.AAC.10